MKKPIFAMIPSAYKASTFYTPIPIDGEGDFTFTRSTVGTRMNKDGLIEEVAANVPRLDYLKDKNCPTLLLEGASTNLIIYSEDLSQSYWNEGGQIRTLSGVSPSGGLAYLVEKGTQGYMATGSIVVTDGNTYTISAWLKSDNNSTVLIRFQELGGDFTSYFSKTITLTNEWVRYEVSGVKGVDGNPARFVFDSIQDGESFYAWGVQVEENEVATSYIETTGVAVARGTDNCTNALSSTLYKGMEEQGSLYFSFYNIQDKLSFKGLSLSNSSNSNRVLLRQNGKTDITAYILNSTGTKALLSYIINPDKGFYKVCFIWEQDNCRLYVDGVLRSQDLTVDLTSSLPYTDFSYDGGSGSSDLLTGRHKELRLYNEVLTEAEAIELTTI